jgi:hypothetical protein
VLKEQMPVIQGRSDSALDALSRRPPDAARYVRGRCEARRLTIAAGRAQQKPAVRFSSGGAA